MKDSQVQSISYSVLFHFSKLHLSEHLLPTCTSFDASVSDGACNPMKLMNDDNCRVLLSTSPYLPSFWMTTSSS
jgi:hypothetical protein